MDTEKARELLDLVANFRQMRTHVDRLESGPLRTKAVNDVYEQVSKINDAGGPDAVALAMRVLMNEIPAA